MKSKTSKRSVTWWIRKANKKGYLLNNLFQIDNGIFQANFRKRNGGRYTGFNFGFGKTPQEAIKNALVDKGSSSMPEEPKRRRPRLPKKFRFPKGKVL